MKMNFRESNYDLVYLKNVYLMCEITKKPIEISTLRIQKETAYLVQCATLISQLAENNNNNKMVFRRDPHFTR